MYKVCEVYKMYEVHKVYKVYKVLLHHNLLSHFSWVYRYSDFRFLMFLRIPIFKDCNIKKPNCTVEKRFLGMVLMDAPIFKRGASLQPDDIQRFEAEVSDLDLVVLDAFGKADRGLRIARSIRKMFSEHFFIPFWDF